eukprot:8834855-Pyramimonas_sp.AAC.2
MVAAGVSVEPSKATHWPPHDGCEKFPCPHGRVVGSSRWAAGAPEEPRDHMSGHMSGHMTDAL